MRLTTKQPATYALAVNFQRIVCLCLLWVFLQAHGFSQAITGTIAGTVLDPSGTTVPGAAVALKNEDTGFVIKSASSAAGEFVFPLLPGGRYTLTATHPGFKSFIKEHIVVEVNQTAQESVSLQLGAYDQSVTVIAEGTELNTSTGGEGTTLEQRTVESVPNLERNPLNLPFLSPNASPSNYTRESYTASGSLSSFSGARIEDNELLMDGASLLNPDCNYTGPNVPLDAVSEVLINTSAYGAEYGRALGATISLSTKSGTNSYHGSAFDYNRVSLLSARNFFDTSKPRLTRNMYGFDVGGPLILPKIYNGRNKTFLFLTYEGFRQIEGAVSLGTVPTAAMRNGNFAGQQAIYDPASTANGIRQPFAGNVIPQNRFDPVAEKLLAYYPDPNRQGAANYVLTLPAGDYYDRWVGRFDQNFGEKHRLFFRYLYDYTRSTASNAAPRTLPNIDADPNARHQIPYTPGNVAFGYTYSISPNMVNELRLNYMRFEAFNTPDSTGQNIPAQLGLTGVSPLVFPSIGTQGYLTLGSGSGGQDELDNIYGLSETLSINRNRHLVKIGGSATMTNLNRLTQGVVSGAFSFNQLPTDQIGQSATSGNPIASLLLGIPTSATVQAPGAEFGYFPPMLVCSWPTTGESRST
jgi:hypothetical protein